MGFADAITREVGWLRTVNDTLPVLLGTAGGPWQVIQGYWPRKPDLNRTGLYVVRQPGGSAKVDRLSQGRLVMETRFRIDMTWPVATGAGSTTGVAEAAQAEFDAAIDLLLKRLEGFPQDKTHGGVFGSVGEEGTGFVVDVDDAQEAAMGGRGAHFTGRVQYSALDFEITG